MKLYYESVVGGNSGLCLVGEGVKMTLKSYDFSTETFTYHKMPEWGCWRRPAGGQATLLDNGKKLLFLGLWFIGNFWE